MVVDLVPPDPSLLDDAQPSHSNDNHGVCQICQFSPASYHLGAITCRPCAAFFRRTIVRRRKYYCNFEDNCTLHHEQRPMCAYCRHKKTLEVGMNVNNIRLHYDKNGPTEQTLRKTKVKQITSSPTTLERLVQGYREFLTKTKELYYVLNPGQLYNDDIPYRPASLPEFFLNDRSQLYFMLKMLEENFPPFNELDKEDKINIFERFQPQFTRLNMIYLSVLNFPDVPKRLVLFHGGYVDEADQRSLYTEDNDMDESERHFAPLVKKFFMLNEKLRYLKVDDTEIAAMTGILLWREANHHFSTHKYSYKIDEITDMLAAHCKTRTDNYNCRLGHLLCSFRDMEDLLVLVKAAVVVGEIMNDYKIRHMHQDVFKMAASSL